MQDTLQTVGRVLIHAAAWGSMYLTVSAHKIYGPKGVRAVVVPLELDVLNPWLESLKVYRIFAAMPALPQLKCAP
jgi:cysteine sulfinate desulfinase/cysteine desulfurase-like protein